VLQEFIKLGIHARIVQRDARYLPAAEEIKVTDAQPARKSTEHWVPGKYAKDAVTAIGEKLNIHSLNPFGHDKPQPATRQEQPQPQPTAKGAATAPRADI
jgi:hypothetical protein